MMKEKTPLKIAMEVSIINIIANTILAVFKLVAGIVANSYAMVSDAVHSASDVLSTFVVMAGVKMSSKEADEKHEFGHERFECVAGIILSMMLLSVGLLIGYKAVKILVTGEYENTVTPGVLAIVAAVVSIIVKEAMFWQTRHYAIKLNSSALKADAWHHRSDALSSVGAFIGILGSMMGVKMLDSIASLVISLLIAKSAISIFMDSIRKMTDEACDKTTEFAMKREIEETEGVGRIDLLHTRMFGNRIYVELEIAVDGNLPLVEAHRIAENIHNKIEKDFKAVKHIIIHVNPLEDIKDRKTKEGILVNKSKK